MKSSYTIQIEPLGFSFFGGENTFNTQNNAEKANYYAKSNYFPQQTGLLGMIRHLLLMYNQPEPLLNKSANEKSIKIGPKSFVPGNNEPYGIIDSLSPLFIMEELGINQFDYWLPIGFDEQKYYDKNAKKTNDVTIKPSENKEVKVFIHSEESSYFKLNGFDYKEDQNLLFKSINTGKTKLEQDFFHHLSKVGVKVNNKLEGDEEDAFYKQDFVKLKKGFSYGVNISLLDGKKKDVPDAMLMPFGADQSEFKVSWKEPNNDLFPSTENFGEGLYQITLLSDAYIPNNIWNYCDFSINNSTDFRHLISETAAKNYYAIGKQSEVKKANNKLNLLSKGSVIYTHQAQIVSNFLLGSATAELSETERNNIKSFIRIGYNYFNIIKINP